MRLCVLSSGSGGNTAWIEADGARVLVDAGLSFRETKRRCADVGLDLRDLTDVLLTHEHADHCFGAASIARKLGARVHATEGTFRALRDLDILVVEANHDARLLLEGPYPPSLKRRVRSDLGHLSNAQAAQLLSQVLHRGLRHVVLAHLSEHNNTPAHARRETEAVLELHGSRAALHLARQVRPLPPIELDLVDAQTTLRPRQLALFAT